MLEHISKVKNVRNLISFYADPKHKFYINTVIYGSNGSGKTSLTKLLAHIADGTNNGIDNIRSEEAREPDEDIDFEMTIDGRVINYQNYRTDDNQQLLQRLHIFNRDFIKENVDCSDFSEKELSGNIATSPLGEESIKIKEAEKSIRQGKKDQSATYSEIENKFEKFCKVLGDKYPKGRNKIWEQMELSHIVSKDSLAIISQTVSDLIDGDNDFGQCEIDLENLSGLTDEDNLKYSPDLWRDIRWQEIQKNLSSTDSVDEIDEDAKAAVALYEQWRDKVRGLDDEKGRAILETVVSESKTLKACPLCRTGLKGNKVASSTFQQYDKYLKAQKSKFDATIRGYLAELKSAKEKIEKISSDNGNISKNVANMMKLFAMEKDKWCKLSIKVIIEDIGSVSDGLNQKLQDPSGEVDCNEAIIRLGKNLKKCKDDIESNRALCSKINKKIATTTKRKTELNELVGKKYLLTFFNQNKSDIEHLVEKNCETKNQRETLEILKSKLLKSDVLTNVKELFNDFINKVVHIDKYSADTDQDGRLLIKLNSRYDLSTKTDRISEGEKQIIGLCYFFACCIKDFGTLDKFEKAIFVIDDPVSSVSYSHFYGICTLIKDFQDYVRSKFNSNKTNSPKDPQRIILTHNMQFFNAARKNIFRDQSDEKGTLINYRLNDSGLIRIQSRRVLSEFEVSLISIVEANMRDKGNFPTNVGNDVRRVLETIQSMFGYDSLNDATFKKLFPGADDKKDYTSLYSLINAYSHASIEGNDDAKNDDLEKGVEILLDVLQNSHFEPLLQKCQKIAKSSIC